MISLNRGHARPLGECRVSEIIRPFPHFTVKHPGKLNPQYSIRKLSFRSPRNQLNKSKISITGSDEFEKFNFDRSKFNDLIRVSTETERKIFESTFNIDREDKMPTKRALRRSLTSTPSVDSLPELRLPRKNVSKSVDSQKPKSILRLSDGSPTTRQLNANIKSSAVCFNTSQIICI
ncbi:unnamed protein product [Blepharisma stoltei]|uniref:Uncharacterized protein n=1 Tax=Blepharisma stoltei TaxID=1481888 RepID=A0AAU9IY12_9CILI|nr:unnamed protein product [Blepharisma stoltei]